MNYEYNCQFSVPIDIDPTQAEDYEYSVMDCQATSTNGNSNGTTTIELIENATTGASFWIRQEVSYGDILIITFLVLFLVFGILKFLTDFLIPKIIKRK